MRTVIGYLGVHFGAEEELCGGTDQPAIEIAQAPDPNTFKMLNPEKTIN